ncbi:MAG: glutaredoxin family protein [Terriglobia bacterium]|nr:MAG: glutaredoxin family protein [Terriglobia bacterium]
MPLVTLYTRKGCCLCDEAKHVIAEARRRAEFNYQELDIDADPELRRLYNDQIPVIAIDGVPAFRYRVGIQELLRKLA